MSKSNLAKNFGHYNFCIHDILCNILFFDILCNLILTRKKVLGQSLRLVLNFFQTMIKYNIVQFNILYH